MPAALPCTSPIGLERPSRAPLPRLEFTPLDPDVAAILLPSMMRLTVAVTGVTGSPGLRERLRQAEAGNLAAADAEALGADLDRLAVLLTR